MKSMLRRIAPALVLTASIATLGAQVPGDGPAAHTVLGTASLTTPVLAGGQPLAAGSYEVRLTDQHPEPLPGQSADGQRYVELVRDGVVVAREVAEVFRGDESPVGTSSASGARASSAIKVQMLKGGDYVRLSASYDGARYLIHLPVAP